LMRSPAEHKIRGIPDHRFKGHGDPVIGRKANAAYGRNCGQNVLNISRRQRQHRDDLSRVSVKAVNTKYSSVNDHFTAPI